MVKPQYALSYNRSKGTANWVSWQLNSSWLGHMDRQNDFRPDDTLPAGWERVTPSVYSRSGYDKGHIALQGRSHEFRLGQFPNFPDDQHDATNTR